MHSVGDVFPLAAITTRALGSMVFVFVLPVARPPRSSYPTVRHVGSRLRLELLCFFVLLSRSLSLSLCLYLSFCLCAFDYRQDHQQRLLRSRPSGAQFEAQIVVRALEPVAGLENSVGYSVSGLASGISVSGLGVSV